MVFLFYFGCLSAWTLLPALQTGFIPWAPDGSSISIWSNLHDMVHTFTSDAHTFAWHGLKLSENLSPYNIPPSNFACGLPVFYAIFDKISPNAPVPVISALIVSGLWAWIFLSIFLTRRDLTSFTLPILTLITPTLYTYFLSVGLFMSEGWALPILVLAYIKTIESYKSPQKSIHAGLLYALAMYFRTSFELCIIPVLLLIPMMTIIHFCARPNGYINIIEFVKCKSNMRSAFIISIVSLTLHAPYKIWTLGEDRSQHIVAMQYFDSPERMKIYAELGSSTVVKANPQKAEELKKAIGDLFVKNPTFNDNENYQRFKAGVHVAREQIIIRFVKDQAAWFKTKIPYMIDFWFTRDTQNNPSQKALVLNIVTTIIAIMSIFLALKIYQCSLSLR